MKNTTYTTDPYLQLTEYTLYLPGLQREVTVLQMSDLHVAVADETSSESYRRHVAEQKQAWEPIRIDFARRYGDDYAEEHLLPPEEGMDHFVRLVNQKRPDAFLMTGDMMNAYSEENLRFLQAAFQRLEVPWMWVCGNHESGHEAAYAPLMQGGRLAQTLSIGNFRLIGLDNSRKTVSSAQAEAALAEAAGCVPVLVMHIPVMTDCNRKDVSCFDSYFLLGGGETDAESAAFLSDLQRDENPFAAILCGHVHGHHVSFYRPGHPQICTSSAMVGACSLLRFLPAEGDAVRLVY